MAAWEILDHGKTLGPMSEEAVLWAIRDGIRSDVRVRREGEGRWIALDDHPPFAEELIARHAVLRKRKRRFALFGYTAYEFLALLAAIGVVVLIVRGVAWTEDNWRALQAERAQRAEASQGALAMSGDAGEEDEAVPAVTQNGAWTRGKDPQASRPPAERARLASAELGSSKDVRGAVCHAHQLLDSIPTSERKKPGVQAAFNTLREKETRLLEADLALFERSRGVICRDGTKPEACRCKAPEGCCVGHGGMVSCEPPPTRIKCP
jgi:hypothetical protein